MRAVRFGLRGAAALAVAALLGCGGEIVASTDGGQADRAVGGDGGAPPRDGGGGGDATAPDGGGGSDAAGGADGGGSDAGPGGAAYRGEVLFVEGFEDTNFGARGWYDSPSGTLSTAEHRVGASAFACRFEVGATGCSGGTPGRHPLAEQEAVYLSYWVKYSANYVGSGHPYHPHEFHFVTNLDDQWVGPAYSYLTTYTEQVGGVPRLALQDSKNVDLACILLNNDSFVGCNGDFDTYPFTEARSVCSCNGLAGDLDGRDCYSTGSGYYSARFWDAPKQVFGDQPGPYYKNDWHFVETYLRLNSVSGGVGVVDGRIRYWFDGELLISSDRILMRTGQHPDMRFDQFIVAPYIGDGSPVDQTMWVDELTVAAGVL